MTEMPALGIIAMSIRAIKKNRCRTETAKCKYLVIIPCLTIAGGVAEVYGCNSEARTCGACCRTMIPIKKGRRRDHDEGAVGVLSKARWGVTTHETIDEKIRKALASAPEIKGYTLRQLAKIIEVPWPTTRWHLESLERREVVDHFIIGRAKVYRIAKMARRRRRAD